MDPITSAKTSWSILKTLNNQKILYQGKYVTDFKKKVELLNSFFANNAPYLTPSSNSGISFNCMNRSLDPNKAHGYDRISIRMLKICDKSICKPLELIFQSCIKHGNGKRGSTRKVVSRF